jgi:pyruvate kinase
LAGEKIRLGAFHSKPRIFVNTGQRIKLVHATASDPANGESLPVPDSSFFSQVQKGDRVTVGDGDAVLVVTHVSLDEIEAKSKRDGVIDQCRGLTIQGTGFVPRTLTEKDIADLNQILTSEAYDVIALSFVSSAADVKAVRSMVKAAYRPLRTLAKIETASGVENINDICRAADMIMAARGDLALSIPWVDLPEAVEAIAAAANANGTPWIIATQIAEGVQRYGIPSRAEICDLAHWLVRGCHGCLLSYETAFGANPIDTVAQVAKLLRRWTNV